MAVNIDRTFACDFDVEPLEELPTGPSPRHFIPHQRAGQDGPILRVRPRTALEWVGTFAFGKFGGVHATRVLMMPSGTSFCVVTGGVGYLVEASHPDKATVLAAVPITDVRVIGQAGLVVFATYTDLLAYDAHGVRWRSPRIALDGLRIDRIDASFIYGDSDNYAADATVTFRVDLTTGQPV